MNIRTERFEIAAGPAPDVLWTYTSLASGVALSFSPPEFEIDGVRVALGVGGGLSPVAPPLALGPAGVEHRYAGRVTGRPELRLELVFRIAEACPVVRFRYSLSATAAVRLTKRGGADHLVYWRSTLRDLPQAREIQFGVFNELVHSYCPCENELTAGQFDHGDCVMGPLLTAGQPRGTVLVAYEHGSQVPDAFLAYRLGPDRSLDLHAVKGNYTDGQIVSAEHPYATVWFEAAGVAGDEDAMAAAYRGFVLNHLSRNRASREPFVYYNTWAFQERNKWRNGKAYLDSMNQERILEEIEVAHRMDVDVFVLDTGWYEKTGDWQVNARRFPDGLRAVRDRLAGYGMKLGLWFAPAHAALSSRMLRDHLDCLTAWKGEVSKPHEVWETEKSQTLCLVSRFGDALADELIRLSKELGVTYFKWDAVQQYGCDAPGHGHGTGDHSGRERAESYAFQLPGALARIANRVCEACPEAIVDFDVTEGGRCFGLEFLTAGKYFLINNGPYYRSYNVPSDRTRPPAWSNLFVHPGPARGWICRTPLSFDRWIPSILFLTHYLPDEPEASQFVNLASLILGQNGVWGDLPATSEAGKRLFGRVLGLYKQVGRAITESPARRSGLVGGSPEIHEKIAARTGCGVVSCFASAPGVYRHITQGRVAAAYAAVPDGRVDFDADGRAQITWEFSGPGAKMVFFGVEDLACDHQSERTGQ